MTETTTHTPGSKLRIYVASSWRNAVQPEVVERLRLEDFEAYDFRHPEGPDSGGFAWSDIDPAWQSWTSEAYRQALTHPIARRGFDRDMSALASCDACVLVHPSGRSAHLEAGYAAGAGKPVFVLLAEGGEPELMLGMAENLTSSVDELLQAVSLWGHEERGIRSTLDGKPGEPAVCSVKLGWTSYRAHVLPKDAPEVQLSETRLAFYAGAAMIAGLHHAIAHPNVSPKEGLKILEDLAAELEAFNFEIRARAGLGPRGRA